MDFITPHDNRWHTLAGEVGPHPTPQPHALLTLEQWHAVRPSWPSDLTTGLRLPNTANVAELAADLPRLALIVLHFPASTDGRAYSQARLLRQRHRYAGELRACGEVLVDMVPLLQRTGFSSVQLRADQQLASAQRALRFFSAHYQGDAVQVQPLFNRQAA